MRGGLASVRQRNSGEQLIHYCQSSKVQQETGSWVAIQVLGCKTISRITVWLENCGCLVGLQRSGTFRGCITGEAESRILWQSDNHRQLYRQKAGWRHRLRHSQSGSKAIKAAVLFCSQTVVQCVD